MTNAQKWVAAFLVLFILLLVLSKITSKSSDNDEMYMSQTENGTETKVINVENILSSNRCYTCHGRDLNGTRMAPALANLSLYWKKDNLISYLQNPQAFMNNERMIVLKERYSSKMPAQENMSMEELSALADLLLNRESK